MFEHKSGTLQVILIAIIINEWFREYRERAEYVIRPHKISFLFFSFFKWGYQITQILS